MSFNSLKNFESIMMARTLGDKTSLHEASLARVWQHVKDANVNGLAILTSWRQSLPKQDNVTRWNDLKSAVRGMGLGFFVVNGHWRECQDPTVPYDQCPEDQLVDAVEPSMVIPSMSLEQATKLGNKFDQDAVIYAGPETDGKVTLYFRSGETMELGPFTPNTISQGFSQLRNGKGSFKFECIEWRPFNLLEARLEETFRKKKLAKSLDI